MRTLGDRAHARDHVERVYRVVARWFARIARQQRNREQAELGYLDLGGES